MSALDELAAFVEGEEGLDISITRDNAGLWNIGIFDDLGECGNWTKGRTIEAAAQTMLVAAGWITEEVET